MSSCECVIPPLSFAVKMYLIIGDIPTLCVLSYVEHSQPLTIKVEGEGSLFTTPNLSYVVVLINQSQVASWLRRSK